MSVTEAETRHPPRATRRRALFAVAAAVAIAAVAVLALLLWPSGGGGSGIPDRALTAVGGGRVLHVITRTPTGDQLVSLRTGRTMMPAFEIESWSDGSSRRFHDIVRVSGRAVNEAMRTHPAFDAVDPNSIWSPRTRLDVEQHSARLHSHRRGETAAPGSARRPSWIGQLLLNRTYVTIRSGISRAALLEAARALRPA